MTELPPLAWGWLGLVALVAAYVRGYSGFGFAALIVSGAALVMDPVAIVPAVLLLDVALALPQWVSIRAAIDWRRVAALSAGAFVGVPLGVRAVAAMNADTARLVVAGWVLLMCLILWRGVRFAREPGAVAHAAVGVVSGLANGAAIGGLPVAAFFAAQPIPAAAFRATLIAYFAFLDVWTLPNMVQQGLVDRGTLILAGLGLPVTLVGLHLGSRHFHAAPPEEFRRFAILLLATLAVLAIGRALL